MRVQIYSAFSMDMQDGFEATRKIRMEEKEHGGRHHEIVALTASALDEDREKCAECGKPANCYKSSLTALLNLTTLFAHLRV